jgi:hypothetical protein
MEKILDPWNPSINFELIQGENKILGPLNIKMTRIVLDFIFENNKLYTKNNEGEFKHLYIIIDNIGKIENISKSSNYRGSEFVLFGLQILLRLNINKCFLIDEDFFVCDRKMNFFSNQNILSKKENIQFKLINLFRYGKTFYSPFGFRPFYKYKLNIKNYENNILFQKSIVKNMDKDVNNEITDLLDNLLKISWNDINEYINLLYKNLYSYEGNYKIRDFTKFKLYWNNLYKSWNYFYEKYFEKAPSPFKAFSFFNYDECGLFINWLELYSFTYLDYNTNIFSEYNGTIAGVNDFKKLKKLIENVHWINTKIKQQPLSSIYNKNI